MRIRTRTTSTLLYALLIAGLAASCTSRRGIATEPARPVTPGGPQQGAVTTPDSGKPGGEMVTMAVPLDEKELQSAYKLDTTNLSYHFKYIDVERSETLTFKDGAAKIEFTGLTAGKAGDLILELLEANVVKARGTVKELSLKAGKNDIKIHFDAVTDGSSAIGDLSINVKIDNGGSGGQSGTNPGTGNSSGGSGGASGDPSKVGFNRDVKPLLAAACGECHHAGKTYDFTKYPFGPGSPEVEADKLLASVASGGKMPPAPRDKMPAAAIETLKKWKEQGLNP